MIADFEDFCLWMYVLIDDLWAAVAPMVRRPGPAPRCSDSELLTMIVVGECCGWDQETELLSQWRRYRHLFPILPERSRFNRRRRHLMAALNALRRVLLGQVDLVYDRYCAIDSLPVPVMRFHLAPGSRATSLWKAQGAAYGKVASKHETIFGYKLHLLVTLGGLIRDFTLAPANVADLAVGAELLAEHTDLVVLGDKGYISRPVAAALAAERAIDLLTIPRANQRDQTQAALAPLHAAWRQIIETINNQLADQFHIEENHAHTFAGLCARLYSKLTAHTLCVALKCRLGHPAPLHIKGLAFPI
jgi:hypothetical protein